MMNISKRLIRTESLPIVDTHCHFDLIFDRYLFFKLIENIDIFLVFILNIII